MSIQVTCIQIHLALSIFFFVSVSGDAEAVGSESVSHPTYVQYVEGDGSTYIPANGQM